MLLLLLAVCALGTTHSAKLPIDIPRCKHTDDACLVGGGNKAIEVLAGDSATRIDSLSSLGLPSLDPLHITRINIDQGSTGPIQLKLSFIEVNVLGIKDAVFTKISGVTDGPKNFHMDLSAKIPTVSLIGQYEISGRVLLLPISGKGDMNLTLSGFSIDGELIGDDKPIVKKGKEYGQLKDFKINLDCKRLYIQLDNLFNGDKALGDTMNTFLNENWSDILNELKPAISDAFSSVLRDITNRLFKRVAYVDVFLQ